MICPLVCSQKTDWQNKTLAGVLRVWGGWNHPCTHLTWFVWICEMKGGTLRDFPESIPVRLRLSSVLSYQLPCQLFTNSDWNYELCAVRQVSLRFISRLHFNRQDLLRLELLQIWVKRSRVVNWNFFCLNAPKLLQDRQTEKRDTWKKLSTLMSSRQNGWIHK